MKRTYKVLIASLVSTSFLVNMASLMPEVEAGRKSRKRARYEAQQEQESGDSDSDQDTTNTEDDQNRREQNTENQRQWREFLGLGEQDGKIDIFQSLPFKPDILRQLGVKVEIVDQLPEASDSPIVIQSVAAVDHSQVIKVGNPLTVSDEEASKIQDRIIQFVSNQLAEEDSIYSPALAEVLKTMQENPERKQGLNLFFPAEWQNLEGPLHIDIDFVNKNRPHVQGIVAAVFKQYFEPHDPGHTTLEMYTPEMLDWVKQVLLKKEQGPLLAVEDDRKQEDVSQLNSTDIVEKMTSATYVTSYDEAQKSLNEIKNSLTTGAKGNKFLLKLYQDGVRIVALEPSFFSENNFEIVGDSGPVYAILKNDEEFKNIHNMFQEHNKNQYYSAINNTLYVKFGHEYAVKQALVEIFLQKYEHILNDTKNLEKSGKDRRQLVYNDPTIKNTLREKIDGSKYHLSADNQKLFVKSELIAGNNNYTYTIKEQPDIKVIKNRFSLGNNQYYVVKQEQECKIVHEHNNRYIDINTVINGFTLNKRFFIKEKRYIEIDNRKIFIGPIPRTSVMQADQTSLFFEENRKRYVVYYTRSDRKFHLQFSPDGKSVILNKLIPIQAIPRDAKLFVNVPYNIQNAAADQASARDEGLIERFVIINNKKYEIEEEDGSFYVRDMRGTLDKIKHYLMSNPNDYYKAVLESYWDNPNELKHNLPETYEILESILMSASSN